MSIYTDLKESGAIIENHESDLYTPDTPAARAMCKVWGVSYTSFYSRGSRKWLDIPGAYTPYWEGKSNATK